MPRLGSYVAMASPPDSSGHGFGIEFDANHQNTSACRAPDPEATIFRIGLGTSYCAPAFTVIDWLAGVCPAWPSWMSTATRLPVVVLFSRMSWAAWLPPYCR